MKISFKGDQNKISNKPSENLNNINDNHNDTSNAQNSNTSNYDSEINRSSSDSVDRSFLDEFVSSNDNGSITSSNEVYSNNQNQSYNENYNGNSNGNYNENYSENYNDSSYSNESYSQDNSYAQQNEYGYDNGYKQQGQNGQFNSQNVVPQFDMEALKAQMAKEIMQSIKSEEEEKEKKKRADIEERERELERVQKEIEEEKAVNEKEKKKKYGRKSKMMPKSSPESNEDYYQNYQIKLRNQKLKKGIFSSIFYLFVASMLACNVYFIFLKQDKSIEQTAYEVKNAIHFTTFPEAGVQGYLEDNFATLIDKNVKVTGGSGASDWSLQKINVRKVAAINDTYANIFFSATIITNTNTVDHNYILTLKYDNNIKSYSPASDLITRVTYDSDTTEMNSEDDVIWGFGETNKYDGKAVSKLTPFLEQFFTMLYNNKTYPGSSYLLEGDKEFNFDNTKYIFSYIDKVDWYQNVNYMGSNCKVTYVVSSSEGLSYTVTSYLAVYEDGNGGYKISSIF